MAEDVEILKRTLQDALAEINRLSQENEQLRLAVNVLVGFDLI
ncbi:MAG: hypothetical protein WBB19_01065 [Desulforhopalus sp.]